MSVFLFLLSLFLFFNSSHHHVLLSKGQLSPVAPHYHPSSHITNFTTALHGNVQKQPSTMSSSSFSLLPLPLPLRIPSSSLSSSSASVAINAKSNNTSHTITSLHSHSTTAAVVRSRSQQNNGVGGVVGSANFNDHFGSIPADLMSSSSSPPPPLLSSLRLSRGATAVPVPSFWPSSVVDATKEMTQRTRIPKGFLSTTLPNTGRIETPNPTDFPVVKEQPNLLLKLDRNYTPKEIAEYILSTGDERGIIQVVADMVQDGQIMASRDDVILFLETVQQELDKLKGSTSSHKSSDPV